MIKDYAMSLFGGKGGSGKTSCAVATGIYYAGKGLKTLIISLNQNHSLSYCAGRRIGNEETGIGYVKNLYGIQMDMKTYIDEWMANLGLTDLFRQVGYSSFSFPGAEEVLGMARIFELKDSKKYDHIIIDTPSQDFIPQLLGLADNLERILATESVEKYLNYLNTFLKARAASQTIRRGFDNIFGRKEPQENGCEDLYKKVDVDQVKRGLRYLLDYSRRIKSELTDDKVTQFYIVTTAGELDMKETGDFYKKLKEANVPVKNLIINKLQPENECGFCAYRRGEERKRLKEAKGLFSDLKIIEVPLINDKNEAMLMGLKDYLFETLMV